MVIRLYSEYIVRKVCSEARGIDQIEFIKGVELSNMKEFAQWTFECDKVLSF